MIGGLAMFAQEWEAMAEKRFILQRTAAIG
jgi:hypothetical protein